MSKPRFITNIDRETDSGQIYWRALWGMQNDPICSMLADGGSFQG